VASFVAKGGVAGEAEGRRCLCNGLLANLGLGQVRDSGYREPPLVTAGDDAVLLAEITAGAPSYTARQVIDHLLSGVGSPRAASIQGKPWDS
jgi:hypothetical protein